MKHTIVKGTSENMSMIPDDTVSLVVTSPPYYVAKDYGGYDDDLGGAQTYKQYLERMEQVFRECYRVLKVGRMAIINIADIKINYQMYPIPTDYIKILQKIGFTYQDDIIWLKPKGMSTSASGKRFGVCMQNPYPMYYYPNHIYEHMIIVRKGMRPIFEGIKKNESMKLPIQKILKEGWESNAWLINPISAKGEGHAAPYPYKIPYRFITLYTQQGETVVEPFLGTGTTMKAAFDLGRNCIGFEISDDYIELVKKKVGWNQQSLLAGKVDWELIDAEKHQVELDRHLVPPVLDENVELAQEPINHHFRKGTLLQQPDVQQNEVKKVIENPNLNFKTFVENKPKPIAKPVVKKVSFEEVANMEFPEEEGMVKTNEEIANEKSRKNEETKQTQN